MVNMALEDSLVRDLLEDAVDPAQYGGLAGSAVRLETATPVISVVSPLASLLACADLSIVSRPHCPAVGMLSPWHSLSS